MLEAKNLSKVYRPKRGVPVTALDNIDLKFPEKGMVFLLGKSGSGKSTLLNVLGGLDGYDSGEIMIKGVSSKNFRQRHFDSYRNTYVGFIFQEYNVLDEFNVGANIALAIELQGRKAADEEINRILREVDLEGYGNRKPNELSGGQKQRVAIARALVKNPEIIMADEPTGALDTNTGRQVFDTLKRLSAYKLVIVVSHDRDFAEQYADRIIELSDGKIISDVELDEKYSESKEKSISFVGSNIDIPHGYHLTEADRIAINEYIDALNDDKAKLRLLTGDSNGGRFKKTDITKIKYSDENAFRLIKSKLPLKNAFKIGAGGLKHKKFRLVITILLSCISFGLFGLADTFGAYNHINTCTNSIVDTGIDYASVMKSKKVGKEENTYWREYGYKISEDNIRKIAENTGVKMQGVFYPIKGDLSFESNTNVEIELTESDYDIYRRYFSGFAEISEERLEELGYKMVAGKLPDGNKNEIAVSSYIYEVFKKSGYTDGTYISDKNGKQSLVYQEIKSHVDLLTKTLSINGQKYTITGIIDTDFDISRYESLIEKKENVTTADTLIDYALYNEFSYASGYSMTCVAMVGEGALEAMIAAEPPIYSINNGDIHLSSDTGNINPSSLTLLDEISSDSIVWLDGAKTALADTEIIISEESYYSYDDAKTEKYLLEDGTTDYKALFKDTQFNLWGYIYYGSVDMTEDGYKIVGIIPSNEKTKNLQGTVVVSERIFNVYSEKDNGEYLFAVGAMPDETEDIKNLVSYCYNDDGSTRFPLQNSVTYELDVVNEVLKQCAIVFLYIGLGFALFATIMLANFIGTSISYKKQEIGILRAIGSRSNDVFRIFFAESFIIAMINFVLSSIGVFVVTTLINYIIRTEAGILITILTFSIRQVLLLFAVSIIVAAVASFLPVKKITAKKPIDAIRDR